MLSPLSSINPLRHADRFATQVRSPRLASDGVRSRASTVCAAWRTGRTRRRPLRRRALCGAGGGGPGGRCGPRTHPAPRVGMAAGGTGALDRAAQRPGAGRRGRAQDAGGGARRRFRRRARRTARGPRRRRARCLAGRLARAGRRAAARRRLSPRIADDVLRVLALRAPSSARRPTCSGAGARAATCAKDVRVALDRFREAMNTLTSDTMQRGDRARVVD